jgi:uncharacterized protein involved in exopolysaccharide biosynthesis
MVNDALRRRLYEAAAHTWGPDEADALMELLPPVGWDDVARQADIREVRAEIQLVRAELKSEIAEVRGEIAEVRGEVADLKGEVADLTGEVHQLFPKLIAANIASMLGVAGVLTAVFQLAG